MDLGTQTVVAGHQNPRSDFFTVRPRVLVTGNTRRRPLHMRDWRGRLDAFLRFNERDVLEDAGKVSMDVAKALAEDAYEIFHRRRLTAESSAPDELEAAAKRLAPTDRAKPEGDP